MSREPRLYLADIADACRRIERMAAGKREEELVDDEVLRDAILCNIVAGRP